MAINVYVLRSIVKDFFPIVDNAHGNLVLSDGFYEHNPCIKDNAKARSFVDKAHVELTNRDFLMVLENLSRTVAAAENSCVDLPEFYIHRARFLIDANYFREAGEDMERALKCLAKDEETESTIRSLQQELQNRSKNRQPIPSTEPPHVPRNEVNQLFPCATRNIKIVDGETKGKRVIATSRLYISENIVSEKPLVIAATQGLPILFCHECMVFSVNPVPCSSCSKVAFCGEVCKESAWERYHKYECNIQNIMFEDQNYQHRLAVKIVLSFHDYLDSRADNLHCPEEYKDILETKINLEEIDDRIKNDYASCAAQIFHSLRENTTFFTDIASPYKFDVFKGLLMKFMLIVDEYKHDVIRSYKYHCNGSLKSFSMSCTGIYSFAKNFRTGCSPNVSMSFSGTTIIIKPLRIIKPGEELFIPGGHSYVTDLKGQRQNIFQKKYSTTCPCEACENNWPLFKDLDRPCDSVIIFNLHLISLALEIASPLDIFAEHTHALLKEYTGIYLVGPSREWFLWQTILIKLHQHMCSNCDTVLHFLRRTAALLAATAQE